MSKPCENCGADLRVCKDCDIYNGYIAVPDNATNGDVYMAVFKPYKVKKNGTCMWVWIDETDYDNYWYHDSIAIDWWNTPYTKEQTDGT